MTTLEAAGLAHGEMGHLPEHRRHMRYYAYRYRQSRVTRWLSEAKRFRDMTPAQLSAEQEKLYCTFVAD